MISESARPSRRLDVPLPLPSVRSPVILDRAFSRGNHVDPCGNLLVLVSVSWFLSLRVDASRDGFLGPGYSDRLLHVGVLFSDLVGGCDSSCERKLAQRSERVKSMDLHLTEPWILASLYSGTVGIWNYQSQNCLPALVAQNLCLIVATPGNMKKHEFDVFKLCLLCHM